MAHRPPISRCAIEALEALERAAEIEHQRIHDDWAHDPTAIGRFVSGQVLRTIRRALGKPVEED